MDVIKKKYTIDVSQNDNFVQVPAVQGDSSGVRQVEFELVQNDGSKFVVSADKNDAYIAGTKPDSKRIVEVAKITKEGNVLVTLSFQMLAVAGRSKYQILIFVKNTNTVVKSFPFYIVVTGKTFNLEDVISEDELTALFDVYLHTKSEATLSKSWAVGGTGTRDGEDTNNSEYWCEQTKLISEDKRSFDSARKLAHARTIALNGAVTGQPTAFDGTQNISIPTTSVDASKLTGKIPTACIPDDVVRNGSTVNTVITIYRDDWKEADGIYSQTVKVTGVKADKFYGLYKSQAADSTVSAMKSYNKDFSIISAGNAVIADGEITFRTYKKPSASVTVRIKE